MFMQRPLVIESFTTRIDCIRYVKNTLKCPFSLASINQAFKKNYWYHYKGVTVLLDEHNLLED